jgi:O-antigen/teichoic acid export membrane protein
MIAAADQATRRNIRLTRLVVLLSFGLNAAANLALIGAFARQGGFALVGQWAWLNAVLMTVLVLDLGLTEALSYRIGRDGLTTSLPLLRRAMQGVTWLTALLTTTSFGLFFIGLDAASSLCLAALAAILQLGSNWRISIRLGQHQQYWFNLKSIVRVFAQTALALLFVALLPQAFGLALALATAALAEFLFVLWATKGVQLRKHPCASLADLVQAAQAFALTNIAHRALQPLSVLLVGLTLDATAVAVFTLALRIPTVISQSVSEALRGLLPGLAALRQSDPARITAVLRDSFATQIMLLAPLVIFAYIFAEALLQLWLGGVPETLVMALRILLIATAITGIVTPFHWANYALGQEKAAAIASATATLLSLAAGFFVLLTAQSVLAFVATFAAVQIGLALAMLAIAQQNGGLVTALSLKSLWQQQFRGVK